MTETKKMREKYGQLALTALCAAGIAGILFLYKGFFPFGKGSVMMTDLYSQYLPLLYRFYDVVAGRKNLFFDLTVAGGADLYAETVNEVLNPFNYVLFLFGRNRLYQAVNVVLMLYLTAACVSANLFLQRLWPDRREWNVILSLCYGLSAYGAYQFQILKWMIFPVLFPLFLLALYRMLSSNRGGAYALLLAWQLALGIQLGFMTLLFVLFSSGIYFLLPEQRADPGARRQKICCLGFYTLAGLLLSGAVLYPEMKILLSSARAGANHSYFGVMAQHGGDDLFERLFLTVHPVLLALLVHRARALKKEKKQPVLKRLSSDARFWLCLNVLLWGTVLLQPANLLWHMGSYVCFPVRYAYMPLLAQLGLFQTMPEPEKPRGETEEKNWGNRAGWMGVSLLCCIVALVFIVRREGLFAEAFSTLAISLVCPGEAARVGVVLGLFFLAALCGFKSGRQAKIAVFFTAAVCSFGLFAMICLPRGSSLRAENEAAYQRMIERYQEQGDTPDRRVKEREDLPQNAALVDGTNTLHGYFSTLDSQYQSAMNGLGYETPWVSVKTADGPAVLDALFSNGEWPVGRAVSGIVFAGTADALSLEGEDVPTRQETVAALLREQETAVVPLTVDAARARITLRVTAQSPGTLFLPFAGPDGWKVTVNEKAEKTQRVLGGFLGVAVTEGENRVEFVFCQPGLFLGIGMTLLGLLLLWLCPRLTTQERTGRIAEAVYRLILAAGWLGIYVVPAAGLVCIMAGKILERLGGIR